MKMINFLTVVTAFALIALAVSGQVSSGGQFELRQTVIANGGGSGSGGTFSVVTTAGQPAAGTTSASGTFSLTGGFQQQDAFAPTSAGVFISGRVLTADGRGIANAVVVATDLFGESRQARTGTFGFYMIDGLQAGGVYIVTVSARQHTFLPQTVSVLDTISGLDLFAENFE